MGEGAEGKWWEGMGRGMKLRSGCKINRKKVNDNNKRACLLGGQQSQNQRRDTGGSRDSH